MKPDIISRVAIGLAVFAAANVLAVVVAYALYPGYLEHGEASISAIAFRLLQGHPAYHPFDAPERITNVYGPWTYLWHAWPVALFGPGLASSKGAAVLGPVLVLATAWVLGRRHGRMGEALSVAFAASFIIMHLGFPVTIRPDSLLTVLVGVATLAAVRAEARPGMAWAETLVIGIAGGIAVNIKIHAGLYLAPVVLFHLGGHWLRLLPMALAGLVTLSLPFLSPLFPLGDYLSWFGPMTAKESNWNGFRILWMKFALYLGIPLAAWGAAGFSALRGPDRIMLAAYVGCVLIALFPATKVGGSHHYYLPFLPVLIVLCLRAMATVEERRPRTATVLVGLVGLTLILAAQTERRFFKSLDWPTAREAVAEIEDIIRGNPATPIQMGVGGPRTEEKFFLYSWRNLPVFAGGPYTQDAGIVMEFTKLGVPMPEEAVRRMAACETRLWLIPKDEEPFSLKGYYDQTVYDQHFRQTFLDRHQLVASLRHFDLWRCRD
jgi:uncharacterized protein (TIGR03382 family)